MVFKGKEVECPMVLRSMSSFARLLGASPSVFSLTLELRLPSVSKHDLHRTKTVTISWRDDEGTDKVLSRTKETVTAARNELEEDLCALDLKVIPGEIAAAVALKVQRISPLIRSIQFGKVSGNAASEALVGHLLTVLALEEIHKVVAGQGFAFFVPALAPPGRWKHLWVLNLSGAGCTHLPETVGALQSLRELRLSHNKLAALPRAIGDLTNLTFLAVDHNQLMSIPGELCHCSSLEELNMEANKITTPVLDLKQLEKLRSLQLYDNPLEYLPELSVCDELRSLSFTQLRVWSDRNYSKFEVEIGGSTVLSRGAKLSPLFALLFRRTSSQHPLVAGALGRLAEYKENCQALVKDQGALQQLILMALSEDSIIQLQAAKVIAHLLSNSLVAEELVRGDVLRAMLVLMKSSNQEIQLSGLQVISSLALISDSISLSLLTSDLLEKLQLLINNASVAQVRHLGIEVLGNLGFPSENKAKMLAVPGLLDLLIKLANGTGVPEDRVTRICAKRALAILGQHDEIAQIVGRGTMKNRGIRVLALDGGGMKGIAAVLMLKELEKRTGERIFDLFDLIGGTSTGAMLACEIGLLNFSLDKCMDIYKNLGHKVFSQNQNEDQSGWKDSLYRMYRSSQQGMRIAITGSKHDPAAFEELLQEFCTLPGESCFGDRFIDAACLPCPKVFALSTLSTVAPAAPFLFRNYEFPPGSNMQRNPARGIGGSSKYNIWQGVRASSAAPYFLDDFQIANYRFQDGATTANNPAAVAVQQARLLWPNNPIDCVVSIGVGSVPMSKREKSSSTFLENGSVLLESACSVENVHDVLSAVLPMVPGLKYFRFAPIDVRCGISLDCVDPDAWEKLECATKDYIISKSTEFDEAATILSSGSTNAHPNRNNMQEYMGARKGLLVLEALCPTCKWAQEISRMCSSLPKAVSSKWLGSFVDLTNRNPFAVQPKPNLREPSMTDVVNKSLLLDGSDKQCQHSSDNSSLCLESLSTSLERLVSPRHLDLPREGRESPESPSAFSSWGPFKGEGNLGKGYEQVHSALLTTLEAIGVVHLTISSISQGSKLVTDWKTSRLPLAEPSDAATELLQQLDVRSADHTLLSVIKQSRDFWVESTFYRYQAMQETCLPSGSLFRSYIFETYCPSALVGPGDIRSIGSLWKGLLVIVTCYINDDLVKAFMDAKVLGIIYPQQLDTPADAAVMFYRSLYKHLWSGCTIPFAFGQAEAASPELSGIFKLALSAH